MALNLAQMRQYARDLTGVYSTDIISEDLLTRWINEAYTELTNSQNWPWAYLVTPLVTNADTPVVPLIDTYLPYRAAVKLLGFEADDTNRAELYNAEAKSVYDQLVLQYLTGATFYPITSDDRFNQYVRFLLGTYSDDVDNSFIQVKLAELRQELADRYVWPTAVLSPGGGEPAFGWANHDLFAYWTAATIGPLVGRDDAFVARMTAQYEQKLADLLKEHFPGGPFAPIIDYAGFVQFVRFLLGAYDNSVSDTLINIKFDEVRNELETLYPWPASIVAPEEPEEISFTWAQAHMFAYAVARDLVPTIGGAPELAVELDRQYNEKLNILLVGTFKRYAVGAVIDSMEELVEYTRFLLNKYDNNVNDAIITLTLLEALTELHGLYTWPWTNGLVENEAEDPTRLPYRDSAILAYAAAVKLAAQTANSGEFIQNMEGRYAKALEELRVRYLVTPAPANTTNLAQLRATVRLITGDFSRVLPDAILNLWINEEYQLLANEKDWAWLEQTTQGTFPANTSQMSLPNGTRNVLEFYIVEKVAAGDGMEKAVAQSEIVHVVPHVMDIERASDKFHYDVTSSGLVTISPAPQRSFTLRVRYRQAVNQLVTDTDTPLMAEQFRSILAYRTGLRVTAYTGAPKAVAELCEATAVRMWEAMNSFYQLDHSMEPFQVGGKGLESRKYLPWFRTA